MITLRFAALEDAADFVEIYSPAVLSTAISFEEALPSTDEMRERIANVIKRYPWFVAEENGKILGYAYGFAHRERASYRWSVDVSVYVREGLRGKGIGRLLYDNLIEVLRQMRFHRAYAGITLPNEGSVGIHEAYGFKHLGTYGQVGFKYGAWHDVGWWELNLNDSVGTPQEPLSIHDLEVDFS